MFIFLLSLIGMIGPLILGPIIPIIAIIVMLIVMIAHKPSEEEDFDITINYKACSVFWVISIISSGLVPVLGIVMFICYIIFTSIALFSDAGFQQEFWPVAGKYFFTEIKGFLFTPILILLIGLQLVVIILMLVMPFLFIYAFTEDGGGDPDEIHFLFLLYFMGIL